MEKDSKVYVAGHNGMVGSAFIRALEKLGFQHIIVRSSAELDLRDQKAVRSFFELEKPDYVIMAAAKVGGIIANSTYKADFIYDNLSIQNNLIQNSYHFSVKKLLFLGSSCIYPKHVEQPIKESSLLTGSLEPTNEPYAIAKIAGLKMCQAYREQYGCNFISVMPSNLYGPNDNYDLTNSHVLPALIRKFSEAKTKGLDKVEVWGTGKPRREFLHVDDLVDACLFLMENYDEGEIVNVGTGEDISITELAIKIKAIINYDGDIIYDQSKPDGAPQKLLDVSRINGLGWRSKISFNQGLRSFIEDFQNNYHPIKGHAD